jgi:hypothetical protein
MASTVKVPLLGTHNKGTVIGVAIGGFAVAGYLIYREVQKNKAAQAATAQAAASSAGYGYGSGNYYGYGLGPFPNGYYGYGDEYGYGGMGETGNTYNYYGYGSGIGQGTGPTGTGTGPTGGKSKIVTVPNVVGDRADTARQALRSAGLTYNISDTASGSVTKETPKAGSRVSRGTRVALTVKKGK